MSPSQRQVQGAINPRASVAEGAAEALEPEWKRKASLESRAQTGGRPTPRPQAEADLDMPPLAAAVVGQVAVVALTTAPMAARRRH
ncbi:hypothetical protein [Vulcanococcus sp. DEBay_Sum22DG08_74]|uniref:hypothetical protein n=1 Tax=Vulcanococcus sp. DEBay_Sum22DG08_74 TaxID=2806299 RepID=UPI0025F29CCC|nr:hypothetical protein [Vulcanococcus sp. DEBay_Sum22DG08_74]